MFDLEDVKIIEGETETDEDGYFVSIQKAVNSLEAWKFQGSYGRAMMAAIEQGRVMLGRSPTADYYGNRIPSRDEVKPGTKGSKEYVAEMSGPEWADRMENV